MYKNALDSIAHAIEHYVANQLKPQSYTYAILHLSQGVAHRSFRRPSRKITKFVSRVSVMGLTLEETAV